MSLTKAQAAKIRLATASPATRGTRHDTLAQLEHLVRAASKQQADFLLLPEAYLGGYPRGADFGCKVGGRTEEGRNEFQRYFRGAVDLGDIVGPGGAGGLENWVKRTIGGHADEDDGAKLHTVTQSTEDTGESSSTVTRARGDGTREELERIARETGVFIVTGLVERAGGSLYCAVVYVCPQRGIIGKRRKVMPTGTERLIWAQGSPATLKAVSTTIRGVRINLAAAICWENYMPLVRQALYAQNINLYFAPTADERDTWLPLMRTVGIEGRCFVVSSNMCVRDRDSSARKAESGNRHLSSHTSSSSDTRSAGGNDGKPRRNSCLTEEGFEIALPPPAPSSSSPPSSIRATETMTTTTTISTANSRETTRSRRRSIYDEDGNEIVLGPPSSHAVVVGVSSSAVFEEDEEEEDQKNGEIGNKAILMGKDDANDDLKKKATCKTGDENKNKASDKEPEKERETFICRGGSSIISPFGVVLAGPQWEDDEGIIYADVDMDDCVRGRLDLDTAGSYSRNDSFKFSVEGLDLDPLPYYT
ncbi:carbon-nitrogen hydrolase [Xylariaceae sp. FL0594]|nr:carbon-nitrogen hydrolase [Xylariaceae sp. FL0594]